MLDSVGAIYGGLVSFPPKFIVPSLFDTPPFSFSLMFKTISVGIFWSKFFGLSPNDVARHAVVLSDWSLLR